MVDDRQQLAIKNNIKRIRNAFLHVTLDMRDASADGKSGSLAYRGPGRIGKKNCE